MKLSMIGFDQMDPHLTWAGVTAALRDGHSYPPASISDGFAYRGNDTLLSRAAWIDGLGVAVKSATVLPGNVPKGLPMIHGGVMLFDDATGVLSAIIDFHLVTKWKTAGDSLLGAQLLARPDSRNITIVGSGTVARNLVSAYASAFDGVRFRVWSRNHDNAAAMVAELSDTHDIAAEADLQTAVKAADIITCATMSTDPVLHGDWLQPGQHVDLIGAYRPDMREVDDTALTRARLFVDSYETTLDHIGELKIPLAAGVIGRDDVLGDLRALISGDVGRQSGDDITLFKNGGGAHLDLMTARHVLERWSELEG